MSTVSVALIPGVLVRMASTVLPVRRGRAVEATVVRGSFLMPPDPSREKMATTGEPKEPCQILWPVCVCVCVCVCERPTQDR